MSTVLHRVMASLALAMIAVVGLCRARPESHRPPRICDYPVGIAAAQRTVVVCLSAPSAPLPRVLELGAIVHPSARYPDPPTITAGEVVRLGATTEVEVRSLSARQMLLLGRPIDLNRATASDLEALPRIGPALSRRILAHRKRHGPFRSIEELRRIRGIGPKTIARLRHLVRVGRSGT